MFDVAPTELLVVAIVALLVIGPKDLPKAMRFVGHWVGRARGVARQFRSGFDAMVREAELAEMEKKWAEENARIMREHPSVPPVGTDLAPPDPAPAPLRLEVSVEHPTVAPAEPGEGAPAADKAPS
jgi:sec-independent protein translocase protein TatB